MARFSTTARVSSFVLPTETKAYIHALMVDLDQDATEIIAMAIGQLYAREIGDSPRDIFAELDALKARLAALEETVAALSAK